MARSAFLAAALFAAFSLPTTGHAQVGIRLERVPSGAIRVDGMLTDWRAIQRIPVGRGDDASMRFALGYDDAGLYVAATVRDNRFVRTPAFGPSEDAIVLTLAFPARRGFEVHELWLFAGEEGRSAGAVSIGRPGARRLGRVPDAQIVERTIPGGYEVEAFVPWRRIPGSARREEGRAAVRLRDVDSEARPEVREEPATATLDPRRPELLPALILAGGDQDNLAGFLSEQGIPGRRPRFDLRGNVQGDARPERVVLVDRFLVVLGEGYRDGTSFDFLALPVRGEGDLLAAELRDMTGDGTAELLMRMRQSNDQGSRDLLAIFGFDGRSVTPLLRVELRKATDAGHVEGRYRVVAQRRGPPELVIDAGEARGLTPESWREAPAADVESILLPWGPVLSRTFRWDGQRFARASERANPRPWTPPPPEPRATTRRETAPAPPGAAELIAAVRRERRIPRQVSERFAQRANVAEDARPEHLVVLGRTLLVVGPGFRGGDGYFAYDVPAQRDDDVLGVEAADLNGDGRAEVLLRVRQHLGEVTREVLLVHQFTRDGSFPRMLAVEVARVQGDRRLEVDVRPRRDGLELAPGRARGFDALSWPWADGDGSDGVDPILLPWRDRAVRYRAVGGRLVR
ncbi:MAG: hypothetical protein KF901_27730 [Myxococcales bacterium]|nr:hypothetical protein [Myxococcales bacterium]